MIGVRAMSKLFGNGPRLSGKLLRIRCIALVLLILLILILTQSGGLAVRGSQETRVDRFQTDPIPASEFSRIIRDFSEQEGLFFSDNFISIETGYLHIVGKLRELRASGGLTSASVRSRTSPISPRSGLESPSSSTVAARR